MMTEKYIQYALARYQSPVSAFDQLLLLPNCKTAPVQWECDLLAISRAGYCTEVEIKVTMSDWKRDKGKDKHSYQKYPPYRASSIIDRRPLIKRFFYAGPLELMKRYEEVWMPEGAGVIGVETVQKSWEPGEYPVVRVLKEPTPNMAARKLTDQEIIAFGRTANVRYWVWAAQEQGDPTAESEASA